GQARRQARSDPRRPRRAIRVAAPPRTRAGLRRTGPDRRILAAREGHPRGRRSRRARHRPRHEVDRRRRRIHLEELTPWAEVPMTEAPETPARRTPRRTVLTIEDSAPVRRGIVDLLGHAGYHSIEASNGREGL